MTDILIRILIALEAIVCLLLIGIVLIQRSKGQGVGLSFGGGAEAVFGAQMGNVLTRATVVLAVIFLVNTSVLAVLKPTARSASLAENAPVQAVEQVADPVASAEDAAEALEFLETEAAEQADPVDVESQSVLDVESVEVDVPDVDVPDVDVPEVDVPEVDVPEVDVPDIDVPEVEAPVSEVAVEVEPPTAEGQDVEAVER